MARGLKYFGFVALAFLVALPLVVAQDAKTCDKKAECTKTCDKAATCQKAVDAKACETKACDAKDCEGSCAGCSKAKNLTLSAVKKGKATLGVFIKDQEGAVEIMSLVPEGPATKSGLKAGDRILKVRKTGILSIDDLTKCMASVKPGDEVDVVVIRDGKPVELKVKTGAGEKVLAGHAMVGIDAPVAIKVIKKDDSPCAACPNKAKCAAAGKKACDETCGEDCAGSCGDCKVTTKTFTFPGGKGKVLMKVLESGDAPCKSKVFTKSKTYTLPEGQKGTMAFTIVSDGEKIEGENIDELIESIRLGSMGIFDKGDKKSCDGDCDSCPSKCGDEVECEVACDVIVKCDGDCFGDCGDCDFHAECHGDSGKNPHEGYTQGYRDGYRDAMRDAMKMLHEMGMSHPPVKAHDPHASCGTTPHSAHGQAHNGFFGHPQVLKNRIFRNFFMDDCRGDCEDCDEDCGNDCDCDCDCDCDAHCDRCTTKTPCGQKVSKKSCGCDAHPRKPVRKSVQRSSPRRFGRMGDMSRRFHQRIGRYMPGRFQTRFDACDERPARKNKRQNVRIYKIER